MEKVSCDLCGSNAHMLLYEEKDRRHGIDGEFNIVKCKDCGLVYIDPRPPESEISSFYPNDFFSFEAISVPFEGTGVKEWLRKAILESYYGYALSEKSSAVRCAIRKSAAFPFRNKIRRIVPRVDNGRVLDIGCGSGWYLALLQELGWDVYGVEPSKKAVKIAREVFGLKKITEGTVSDCDFDEGFFDLITLWHVLEHLHNPKQTLQKINRVLKHDGVLIIGLPNIDSFEARLFKGIWTGVDAPRHLYDFSPTTIEKMLKEAGFHVIKLDFCSSPLTFTASLRQVLDERFANRRVTQVLKQISDSRLSLLLLKPYCYLADKLRAGSCFEVYAKKNGAPGKEHGPFNNHCQLEY